MAMTVANTVTKHVMKLRARQRPSHGVGAGMLHALACRIVHVKSRCVQQLATRSFSATGHSQH